MDMYVPNWGLNVPVTKAGVEGSCLPETRLTSHQSVWGRRFPVLAGFRAEWEPGAIAAPSCSPLDAQAPSPWIFHVLTENLLSPRFSVYPYSRWPSCRTELENGEAAGTT